MHQECIIGTHSRDRKVSVFLHSKNIVSVDGESWTPINGFVIANSECYCKLECVFSHKTPLGITKRIIYQDIIKCCLQEGNRYSFEYKFGKKSLPASFVFSKSLSHGGLGVHWYVSGMIGKFVGDQFMASSSATMEIFVGYRYTRAILSISPLDKPIAGEWRFKLMNLLKFQNLPTMNVEIKNPIQVLPKLFFQIYINITNAISTTTVQRTKVTLKQDVTLCLPNLQKLHFKNFVELLNEAPAPKYLQDDLTKQCYVVELDIADIPALPNDMAVCKPFSWQPSDGLFLKHLAPSTFYGAHVLGQNSVTIEYSLHVVVTMEDIGWDKDLIATVPVVIGSPLEDPVVLGNLLTHDTFLPILNSLFEDVTQCLPIIKNLKKEWKFCRRNATENDRMVTFSSDHAYELMNIFDILVPQINVFLDLIEKPSNTIPWPKNTLPFNMFILELELLARASPSPTATEFPPIDHVDILMNDINDFLHDSVEIITAWMKNRPFQNISKFRQKCESIMFHLECIAQGQDKDDGTTEKPCQE